ASHEKWTKPCVSRRKSSHHSSRSSSTAPRISWRSACWAVDRLPAAQTIISRASRSASRRLWTRVCPSWSTLRRRARWSGLMRRRRRKRCMGRLRGLWRRNWRGS
ncbi:MAG: hypothetical protein M1824_005059, partial [Vezdaea acicularis]